MTNTDKLSSLIAKCKAGMYIEVNDHRTLYLSAQQWLDEIMHSDCPPEIDDPTRIRMIQTDTIVSITFYPKTPVSFYKAWGSNIDEAVDNALGYFSTNSAKECSIHSRHLGRLGWR